MGHNQEHNDQKPESSVEHEIVTLYMRCDMCHNAYTIVSQHMHYICAVGFEA
jgi:hypothetical protein